MKIFRSLFAKQHCQPAKKRADSRPALAESEQQTVVKRITLIGCADCCIIVRAAAVREIAALYVHTLCAAIAAVQADAEPDDIALRERKFFRSVHQFCANSPAPAALQYAEIDEFRTVVCLVYAEIAYGSPVQYGGE